MSAIPTITLRDESRVPCIGFGTGWLDDGATETAVGLALDVGYRMFDTAANYGNEEGTGRALQASDVPRDSITLITKLPGTGHGYEAALREFEASRQRLQLEYIDVYLIHWPMPARDLYLESWRAMIHLRDQGLVRSIGVSNFLPSHIDRLVEETGELPALNQIESHLGFMQHALRAAVQRLEVVPQAWSPLGSAQNTLEDPALAKLAEQYGKTPAQIILRWHVELGTIPIPRSARERNIKANLEIFDFELTSDTHVALDSLVGTRRLGGDPITHEE